MDVLATLIILIPAALIVFWLWMFNDMLHNDDIPNSHPVILSWPPEAKNHWIIFFIILSIFTAGYYYSTVYHAK